MPGRRIRVEWGRFAVGAVAAAFASALAISSVLSCGGRADIRRWDDEYEPSLGGAASVASLGGAPASAPRAGAANSAGAANVGGALVTVGASRDLCRNARCPAGLTCVAGRCLLQPETCGENTVSSGLRTIVSGNGTVAIVIGDWNGDGIADFATANDTDASVSVMLGRGGGTFAPKVEYRAGSNPFALMSCDFNGDQRVDLVAANRGAKTATVLFGKGDGTFASTASFQASAVGWRQALVCADLSRDGLADIALTDGTTGAVKVLLGTGNGMVLTNTAYLTREGVAAIAVGDLNADGRVDLVTGNGSSEYDVSALLGHGDGTFAKPVDHRGSHELILGLAIGDLNGDGRMDLGLGNPAVLGPPGFFGMMPGNGDGTFGAAVDYPPSVAACEVATGDLNNDGRLDLVGVTSTGISVLLGQSGGGLVRGCDFNIGEGDRACTFASGDLNGDGNLDILIASGRQQVALLLGVGDGTFH